MQKKYLIFGVIGTIFVLTLVGVLLLQSQGGNRPPVRQAELTWWKTFEDPENIQELINAYQTLNKGVRIKYVKKDINDYEKELIDAIAAGRGPDILTIHNDWLPNHIDKLTPMPATLMSERQYRESFVDVASADFIDEGKIYAVPLSVDVLALYYNKDILNSVGISEPPKTWTEVETAVQKITRQDRNADFIRSGIAMGTSSNINRSVDIISLLMLQNGTEFYNENRNVILDTQVRSDDRNYNPASAALEYYAQFANPGKRVYTWNARTNNSVDAFSQGTLGMMVSYYYMQEMIRDKAPNLNWAVAPVPQVDNSGIKVNFANYWGESVSKASANPDVAWDFLKFITQKDSLEKYYAKHKLPASRKDMVSAQFSDLNLGVFAENSLTAQSVYKEDAALFEGIFLKMIDDVVLRNVQADEAVRNAAQQMRLIPRK